MSSVTKRCLVSGRVQGVFFRATTARRARELELESCSARNLPDGRVEVIVAGDEAKVAALCDWLWTGSPASDVTAVVVDDYDGKPPAGITTG